MFNCFYTFPFAIIGTARAGGCGRDEGISCPPLFAVLDGEMRITSCRAFYCNSFLCKKNDQV